MRDSILHCLILFLVFLSQPLSLFGDEVRGYKFRASGRIEPFRFYCIAEDEAGYPDKIYGKGNKKLSYNAGQDVTSQVEELSLEWSSSVVAVVNNFKWFHDELGLPLNPVDWRGVPLIGIPLIFPGHAIEVDSKWNYTFLVNFNSPEPVKVGINYHLKDTRNELGRTYLVINFDFSEGDSAGQGRGQYIWDVKEGATAALQWELTGENILPFHALNKKSWKGLSCAWSVEPRY